MNIQKGCVYALGELYAVLISEHQGDYIFLILQDAANPTHSASWPSQLIHLTGGTEQETEDGTVFVSGNTWEVLFGMEKIKQEDAGIFFTANCVDMIPSSQINALMNDANLQSLFIKTLNQ